MVRPYVVHLVVLQILDEQILDEIPPFLGVVLRFLADVAADVELRHLLKMDCFRDEADVELRHLLKMDCFRDEELVQLAWLHFQLRALPLHSWRPLLCWQLLWLVQALTPQYLRQVLRLTLQLVLR